MRISMAPGNRWAAAAAALSTLACAGVALGVDPTGALEEEELSAGQLTVAKFDEHAFDQAPVGMPYQPLQKFLRGRHHFNQRWVQFPSIGGDWGLGPTFITNKCVACHVRAGRGAPPEKPDEQVMAVLVRLSIPGENRARRPEAASGLRRPDPEPGPDGTGPRRHLPRRARRPRKRKSSSIGRRAPSRWPTANRSSCASRRSAGASSGSDRSATTRWCRCASRNRSRASACSKPFPRKRSSKLAEEQKKLGFNGRPNWVRDDINKKTVARPLRLEGQPAERRAADREPPTPVISA